MRILAEPLPGTYLLEPRVFSDHRGDFVKTFHTLDFAALGIPFNPVEEFFSTSQKNVLRGMHFQMPPHDHEKLVYCLRGTVLDVLLDLRKSSPTYGRASSAELSETNRLQCFIPKGVAHGFLSLSEGGDSLMVYKTSTIHAPTHDAGIRWDSFGFNWPKGSSPILSERDANFPALADFVSPFS